MSADGAIRRTRRQISPVPGRPSRSCGPFAHCSGPADVLVRSFLHVGCGLRRPKGLGTHVNSRGGARFPVQRAKQMAKVEIRTHPSRRGRAMCIMLSRLPIQIRIRRSRHGLAMCPLSSRMAIWSGATGSQHGPAMRPKVSRLDIRHGMRRARRGHGPRRSGAEAGKANGERGRVRRLVASVATAAGAGSGRHMDGHGSAR